MRNAPEAADSAERDEPESIGFADLLGDALLFFSAVGIIGAAAVIVWRLS